LDVQGCLTLHPILGEYGLALEFSRLDRRFFRIIGEDLMQYRYGFRRKQLRLNKRQDVCSLVPSKTQKITVLRVDVDDP